MKITHFSPKILANTNKQRIISMLWLTNAYLLKICIHLLVFLLNGQLLQMNLVMHHYNRIINDGYQMGNY